MPYKYTVRERNCIFCKEIYSPTSTRQKICSKIECKKKLRKIHTDRYYRENSIEIYQRSIPYSKKKYSRQKAHRIVERLGWTMLCSKNKEHIGIIDVHHKDGNPFNNDIPNLLLLCRSCHKTEHLDMVQQSYDRSSP